MTLRLSADECLGLRGPLIVLTDNYFDGVAWMIRRAQRKHSLGFYNHAMWLESPGEVVTQGWRLRRRPLADYLTGRHRVKFISGRWNHEQERTIRRALIEQVRGGGRYDWPGIFGQWMGLRRFNLSGRFYCSEAVGAVLRRVDPFFVDPHPTPSEINEYTKGRQGVYRAVGVFDPYAD